MKQHIHFCTAADGVRLARWAAKVRRSWCRRPGHPSRASVAQPCLATVARHLGLNTSAVGRVTVL